MYYCGYLTVSKKTDNKLFIILLLSGITDHYSCWIIIKNCNYSKTTPEDNNQIKPNFINLQRF